MPEAARPEDRDRDRRGPRNRPRDRARFAREGARVVVNDLGGATDGTGAVRVADEVVTEIEAPAARRSRATTRVATVEGGRRIFQTALDAFGGCDVLVNNAGILRDKTIFNMEEDDWDAVIAVHLKGHYSCSRPFARYIRETNRQRLPDHQLLVGVGPLRQLRAGELRRRQGRHRRLLARARARARQVRLHREHHLAGRRDPHDHPADAGARREGRGRRPEAEPAQIAPVVTWLCLAGRPGHDRQIIGRDQGQVAIMQQYAVIRSFTKGGELLTQDDLDA